MARGTIERVARKGRPTASESRLTVYVVEVPADWRPRSTHDRPRQFQIVERAGRYAAGLARVMQDEFNVAELTARHRGRATNLWMLTVADPATMRQRVR